MIRRIAVVLALVSLVGAAVVFEASAIGAGKAKGLSAEVVSSAGSPLGTIRFLPQSDGKVKVTARLSGLTPGFHGFHVHSVAVCDPQAVDANQNPSPFFTAGGHFNPAAATHGAHPGDMPPLLATEDGTTLLRFMTDRFRTRDLMDADGSAVIVHAGPDNLAHIPAATSTGAERYHSHVDDVFGADTATRATGDAGARSGCGVISKAS